MKTYRQREKQGSKVQESTKGPDEAKIKVTVRRMQTEVILDVLKKYQYYLDKCVHAWLENVIATEESEHLWKCRSSHYTIAKTH